MVDRRRPGVARRRHGAGDEKVLTGATRLIGSRTGAIAAAVLLGGAGVVMLGIGLAMLLNDAPVTPTAAPVSYAPPDTAVLSEVDNPVLGPSNAEPGRVFSMDAPALVPTRVRIPSIEVDAGVINLGLNPDRTLEVPEDISVTGWYTGRSVPGEVGPSVVVGHVDSAVAGAGVFYNLRQLQPGDTIEIERSDGLVAQFSVTELVLVDKDAFPTDEVYGATEEPTLRLITCGGGFDRSVRSYEGNVIVYAEHVANRDVPFGRS